MSDEMRVDRCECIGKKFSQLQKEGSLEAVMAQGAGSECEGCLPYLKLMFASGETEFDVEDPRIQQYE